MKYLNLNSFDFNIFQYKSTFCNQSVFKQSTSKMLQPPSFFQKRNSRASSSLAGHTYDSRMTNYTPIYTASTPIQDRREARTELHQFHTRAGSVIGRDANRLDQSGRSAKSEKRSRVLAPRNVAWKAGRFDGSRTNQFHTRHSSVPQHQDLEEIASRFGEGKDIFSTHTYTQDTKKPTAPTQLTLHSNTSMLSPGGQPDADLETVQVRLSPKTSPASRRMREMLGNTTVASADRREDDSGPTLNPTKINGLVGQTTIQPQQEATETRKAGRETLLMTVRPRALRKLPNPFNEVGITAYVGQQLKSQLTTQLNNAFASTLGSNIRPPDLASPSCEPTAGPSRAQYQQYHRSARPEVRFAPVENCSLTAHLDIEAMLSMKSKATICYKMRDKRFFIKGVPQSVLDLEDHVRENNQEYKSTRSKKLNKSSCMELKLFDSWINVPPQVPYQNFVTCHGVVEKGGKWYVQCDLVEEDEQTVAQRVYSDYRKLVSKGSNTKILKSLQGLHRLDQEDKMMNEDTGIPRSGTTGVSETFFGPRRNPADVNVAKDVYGLVKDLRLGHLSALEKIPDFYVTLLVGFVMQISAAMAHAHKHGLVHGNLSPAKILVQKLPTNQNLYKNIALEIKEQQSIIECRDVKEMRFVPEQDNYDFQVTNFEPYKVHQLMRQYKSKNAHYQNLAKIEKMRPDIESTTQLVKIMDLQGFANCLVEIMVGKSIRESPVSKKTTFAAPEPKTSSQQTLNDSNNDGSAPIESKQEVVQNQKNLTTGGVPLDLIPLKWRLVKDIQIIFEILQLCLGPYNECHNLKIDTSKVFTKINALATQLYRRICADARAPLYKFYTGLEWRITPVQQRRLRSMQLNNQAVHVYLSLDQAKGQEFEDRMNKKIAELLEKAQEQGPTNQVSMYNQMLHWWSQGEIRDDQFQTMVQSKLKRLDKELARLVFVLFKKNIEGGTITKEDMKESVAQMESKGKVTSKIARQIFDHPDFYPHRKAPKDIKVHQANLKYVSTRFHDDGIKSNQLVSLPEAFEPQSLFFSNNDQHLAVIGAQRLLIVDVKTGQKQSELLLPHCAVNPKCAQLQPDVINGAAMHSPRCHSAIISSASVNSSESGDLRTRKEKQAFQSPADMETVCPYSYDQIQQRIEKDKHLQLPTSIKQQRDKKFNYHPADDKKLIDAEFPTEWEVSISESGKAIALFDRAQQRRNSKYYFKENIEEWLLVYELAFASKIEPRRHQLDVNQLLQGQEVLSFDLDHEDAADLQNLCVQAKDLCLYILDFGSSQILRKIDSPRQAIAMKSIFRDVGPTKLQKLEYYEPLKEYIQNQEQLGNEVRLPKLNEEIVAVKNKNSALVKLYSIKKKRVVRQLMVFKDEASFKANDEAIVELLQPLVQPASEESGNDEDVDDQIAIQLAYEEAKLELGRRFLSLSDQRSHSYSVHSHGPGRSALTGDQTATQKPHATVLGPQLGPFPNLTSPSPMSGTRGGDVMDKLRARGKSKDQRHEKIGIFEISCRAKVLAAQIGRDIFIRVLNQVNREQSADALGYHQSIAFMPIYLDQDYNYDDAKANFQKQKATLDKPSEGQAKEHAEPSFEINTESIKAAIQDYDSIYRKELIRSKLGINDKLLELAKVVQTVTTNPKQLLEINIKRKDVKHEKIKTMLEMSRRYAKLDREHIYSEGLQGTAELMKFNNFDFKRSFEYVKDFKCSSAPSVFLIAALIDRSLHVYDFVTTELVFKTKLPHSRSPNYQYPCGNLFFLDHDQLIGVQDGDQRILIFSIKTQIDLQQSRSVRNQQANDIIELPGLESREDVSMGFSHLDSEAARVLKSINKSFEAISDDDDDGPGVHVINHDAKISRIVHSRNVGGNGYIAVISDLRFVIYYLYEDVSNATEIRILWDKDYRFDKEFRKYGKILAGDFDDGCRNFTTSTSSGWILVWNLLKQHLDHAVQIFLPGEVRRPLRFGMIRDVDDQRLFVGYSLQLQQVYVLRRTNGSALFSEDTPVHPEQLDYLSKAYGNVIHMKVDVNSKFLTLSFASGQLCIYSLSNLLKTANIPPFEGCHLNGDPTISRLYVDDLCHYVAYLGEDQKSLQFRTLNWNYKCQRIPRTLLPALGGGLARQVKAREQALRRAEQDAGLKVRLRGQLLGLFRGKDTAKSKTCTIF